MKKSIVLSIFILFIHSGIFSEVPPNVVYQEFIVANTPRGWTEDGRYFVFEQEQLLPNDSHYVYGVVLDTYTMKSRLFLLSSAINENSECSAVIKKEVEFYFGNAPLVKQRSEFQEWLGSHPLKKDSGPGSPDKKWGIQISSSSMSGAWKGGRFYYTRKTIEEKPDPNAEYNSPEEYKGPQKYFPIFSLFCTAKNGGKTVSGCEYLANTESGTIEPVWSPDGKRVAWIVNRPNSMITLSYSAEYENKIFDFYDLPSSITINSYTDLWRRYQCVIGPARGPRVKFIGGVGVLTSPLFGWMAEKIAQAGYVLTSVETTEDFECSDVLYAEGFKDDAGKISGLIGGTKKCDMIRKDGNAEIVIMVGDKAYAEYCEENDFPLFTFDAPFSSLNGPVDSFVFHGWSKESRHFAYSFESTAIVAYSHRKKSAVTNLVDTATGYVARFASYGDSDIEHFKKRNPGIYWDGAFKHWKSNHTLVQFQGVTSPDGSAHVSGKADNMPVKAEKGKLFFDIPAYVNREPENLIFHLIKNGTKSLIADASPLFYPTTSEGGYQTYDEYNSCYSFHNAEAIVGRNTDPLKRGKNGEIEVLWSPDSKQVLFVLHAMQGCGPVYSLRHVSLLLHVPAGGPRIELKLYSALDEDHIKDIRIALFEKGLFVTRVTRDTIERKASALHFAKDFATDADSLTALFPEIGAKEIVKNYRHADMVFEVGNETIAAMDARNRKQRALETILTVLKIIGLVAGAGASIAVAFYCIKKTHRG